MKKGFKVSEEVLEKTEQLNQEELIDFDEWWASVEYKLPIHHRKEIVFADFVGRGVKKKSTAKEFEEALLKYGLKIK